MFSIRFGITAIVLIGLGLCLTWIVLSHYQMGPYRPLQEPTSMHLPESGMPVVERASFLEGDFTIINKMRALPPVILGNFTEPDGDRLTIADPGREFRAGDVVYDASIPRKRLIFAGMQSPKCFIHYEQGGRGLSFVLAFFSLGVSNRVEPVWVGYCNRPATSLTELRSMILNGGCISAPGKP